MDNFNIIKNLSKLKKTVSLAIINNRFISRRSEFALLDKINGKDGKRGANRQTVLSIANAIISAPANKSITKSYIDKTIKSDNILNKGMSFTSALNEIKSYLIKNNIRTSFEIDIQPLSLKNSIKNKRKFKHFYNYINWMKSFNPKEIDSDGHVYTDIKNINDFVKIVSIEKIHGGISLIKAGEKSFNTNKFKINCYRPKTNENNCLFTAIKYLHPEVDVDVRVLRHKFNISGSTTLVAPHIANDILKLLNVDITIFDISEKIDPEWNSKECGFILLNKSHYYPVINFEEKKMAMIHRSLLTFDFETRNTEEYEIVEATGQKMYIIKDTILSMYYRTNSMDRYHEPIFNKSILITDSSQSSARKFINFLKTEDESKRHYNIIAHNGSNFDFYLLVSEMTEDEVNECEISLRGTSIIGITFRNHKFKDSYCFLTSSLSKLSDNYKIEHGKITSVLLHSVNISSSNLCFYKDHLKFNEFMSLQKTDVEFWELYEKYCIYDSIALYEIWEQFTKLINGMIESINPYILKSCPLSGSMTIGGHSKKILNDINKFKGKSNCYKAQVEKFYLTDDKFDKSKYDFLCNFKRGGISHCNKMGNHKTGVVGFDIKSQYPTCLRFASVPCGNSWFTTTYDSSYFGFYHYEYLYFNNTLNCFRPIAEVIKDVSLNWKVNDNIVNNQYIDGYMIEYLVKNNGLDLSKSKLINGLVSNKQLPLEKLFSKYIDTFYNEKARQDHLKDSNDPMYNNALRETIKLYLNSLTGKLVEEPRDYFQLSDKPKTINDSFIVINGVKKYQEFSESYNEWLTCGLMVYSYSKQLLFEYINCLPNKDNDVIHIETDGIYFSKTIEKSFIKNVEKYNGKYPSVAIGQNLGNIEFDKGSNVGTNNYFLGKKFYLLNSSKPAMRIKGIPQATIDDAGNKIQLVDEKLYKDIFEGKTLLKSFKTLKRCLETEKTQILSLTMTRTIRPMGEYKTYE